MENASTALLIAGGILLAILTISLLLYTSGIISNFGNERQKQEELQHIANWNAEWEAYNKTRLYGADVVTVCNKAEQNNIDNLDDIVEIKLNSIEVISKDIIDKDTINKIGRSDIFRCTEIHYNDKTGKVDRIKFESVL